MNRELLKQALDALENDAMQRTFAGGVRISNAAIALRAALAEPAAPQSEAVHEARPATEDDMKVYQAIADNYYRTAAPSAPAAPQGEQVAQIDPTQDPLRPTLARLGPPDEHPAESVLRALACWLGVGGFNAPTVAADLYHRKIVDGINSLIAAQPSADKIIADLTERLLIAERDRDNARECAHRMAARMTDPPAAPSVPTGWRLVPVEPMQEMLSALEDALNVWVQEIGEMSDVYRAMLEAAPEAPSGKEA